ncbi:MAG: hypothetical protein M3315_15120, partial [Actinomycetota bacterium]|nr:hypothetical protein [Actinomycetota bacterium]
MKQLRYGANTPSFGSLLAGVMFAAFSVASALVIVGSGTAFASPLGDAPSKDSAQVPSATQNVLPDNGGPRRGSDDGGSGNGGQDKSAPSGGGLVDGVAGSLPAPDSNSGPSTAPNVSDPEPNSSSAPLRAAEPLDEATRAGDDAVPPGASDSPVSPAAPVVATEPLGGATDPAPGTVTPKPEDLPVSAALPTAE